MLGKHEVPAPTEKRALVVHVCILAVGRQRDSLDSPSKWISSGTGRKPCLKEKEVASD